MNIEEYAHYLSSFDMRRFDDSLFKLAKENDWLVVFGHSDDCIELRGAFRAETYYNRPEVFPIYDFGLLPSWDEIDHSDEEEARQYFKRKKSKVLLRLYVFQNEEYEDEKFMWFFDFNFQNYKFKIYDEDEPFCVGCVVDINKVKGTRS